MWSLHDYVLDVQGMLDAWDNFDSTIVDARVVEFIANAVFDMDEKPKIKLKDPWDLDSNNRLKKYGLTVNVRRDSAH